MPTYFKRHRWFAGKARPIQQVKLLDVLTVHDVEEVTDELKRPDSFPGGGLAATRILLVRVEYVEGEPEIYVLPVVFAQGGQELNILGDRPSAGIISVAKSTEGTGATLCDTTHETEFWLLLYNALASGSAIPGQRGQVESFQTEVFPKLSENLSFDISVHGGEQSNTSAILGNQVILKLFRRIDQGENPDLEIGRYLTEQTGLACVPQVGGALGYKDKKGTRFTLAVLHKFVANEGDAWVYTLDELDRYLELIKSEWTGTAPAAEMLPHGSLLELADQEPPELARQVIGTYLESTELLGRRTAELHLALAAGHSESFAPEPFTKLYQRSLYQSMRSQARRTLSLLRKQLKTLPEAVAPAAERLVQSEAALLERFRELSEHRIHAARTRCHGDFHLGQVLFTGKDFVIIDFEGEPDRPIGERRIKHSPLRDVAGMIRSIHYASHATLRSSAGHSLLPSEMDKGIADWFPVWYVWSAASYLKAYLAEASRGDFLPAARDQLEILLDAYLLEKAVYELGYELNNRPDWVPIPLEGILHLIETR